MSRTEITSAAQLHAALTADDADVRLGTLEAVVADPRAALGFGLHAERDIVDVLLAQARSTPVAAEWLTLLNALAVFADPRVAEYFTQVLAENTDPAILFLAADYLAARRVRVPRAHLERWLLQNDCAARARAAAPLVAGSGAHTAAERVRIALLVDDGPAPPPFASAADAYVAELRGPFAQDARAALFAQGDAVADDLLARWDALDDVTRAWLIDWAAQTLPATTIDAVVGRVAASGDESLLRVALSRVAERPDASLVVPEHVLATWLRHADAEIRRAATLKSAAPLAWPILVALASDDVDPRVRAAATRRLSADFNTSALPRLLETLGDEHWQVRAAAVDGLAALGPDVRATVRPLVHDPRIAVRVAAVDVLLRLNDDAWLDEHLLADGNSANSAAVAALDG